MKENKKWEEFSWGVAETCTTLCATRTLFNNFIP